MAQVAAMPLKAIMSCLNGHAITLFLVGVVILICARALAVKVDSEEPPLVSSKTPYFGHLIGLIQHHTAYLAKLGEKHVLPAFTINVLSSKLYVITHPALVQAALCSKTLTFDPASIQYADLVMNVSVDGMKVIGNSPDDQKVATYLRESNKLMHSTMAPGNALLHMNARLLEKVSKAVNEIGTEWESKCLYQWIKEVFTTASTSSLYGRQDPFSADPSLCQSLWDFDCDQLWLMLKIFPSLLAPKAHAGRQAIQTAFRNYFAAGHDSSACDFVKDRAALARKCGLSNEDIGNVELAIIFTATTNAIPTIFWLLCYVLKDPKLHADIRAEVMTIIETEHTDSSGVREMTIDIAKFNTHCPLLTSAYHECLRLTSSQVSVRWTLSDTVLTIPASQKEHLSPPTSYLFKKGSAIQMPSGGNNKSTSIWGPDAKIFEPRRFLASRKEALNKEEKKTQAAAFVPFGGGKHLCPGRYFALTEILGLLSVIVAGFEIIPDQEEIWSGEPETQMEIPEQTKMKAGEGIRKPASDPKRMIRRRADLSDVKWSFKVGEGLSDFSAFENVTAKHPDPH